MLVDAYGTRDYARLARTPPAAAARDGREAPAAGARVQHTARGRDRARRGRRPKSPNDATALGHRDAAYDLIIAAVWAQPAERELPQRRGRSAFAPPTAITTRGWSS